MHRLLAALGIQIAGGLVALLAGRSARLATLAGAATSVAGCGMGLAGLAAIYWGDSSSSFHAAGQQGRNDRRRFAMVAGNILVACETKVTNGDRAR